MATVPGAKRRSATNKRMTRAAAALRRSREKSVRYMTQRACTQCDPTRWVSNRDWNIHRENFHKPGGFEFEKRKAQAQARADAVKAAEKATKDAAKAPPPRPQRPASKTKAAPGKTTTKGTPAMADTSNGTAWTSSLSRKGSQNGESGNQAAGATTSLTEGIVELFRTWAIQTPPSIPASRVDAQAAADMWRGIADALRARARAEQENNNLSSQITEPLEQAAQVASQIGDQHQEVVRRIQIQYGEVAEVLSRPDTPNATYLEQGR